MQDDQQNNNQLHNLGDNSATPLQSLTTQPDQGTIPHYNSQNNDSPSVNTQNTTQNTNSDYSSSNPSTTDDNLDVIKKDALQQLEPLVDQLELSTEERFKTTMMMLQASDNQSLIKKAYELAQQIDNPKVKAQALLDIVNEINYFNQVNKT